MSMTGHTTRREEEAQSPSTRLAQFEAERARAEQAQADPGSQPTAEVSVPRAGPLRRTYDRVQALRRWRRERKPVSKVTKFLLAFGTVGALGVTGYELIVHGHRELGTDFTIAAALLLLLTLCVIFARHFLAQELE